IIAILSITLAFTYLLLMMIIAGVYDPNKTILVAGGALKIPYNIEFINTLNTTLIIALLPSGIAYYINLRRKMNTEQNLPIFLRDLAELVRTGIPLTKAIEELSFKDYGALTPLLKRLALRMMFGEDLGRAVEEVFKGESPITRKLSLMVAEAYYSGGRAAEVLRTASNFALILQRFNDERRRELKVYGVIVYMAIIVYLIVSAILLYMNMSMYTSPGVVIGGGRFAIAFIPPWHIKAVLYYASIILMITCAIVLSKVYYGVFGPGLLHASILLLVVMVYFTFIDAVITILTGVQVGIQPKPPITP
ncbi:MAG TPA: hypothetical protein EYH40_00605, partial [Desulfurococcales archaeon]|nr:hypothetical protein [Desulfurococcales archaeon]